MKRLYLCARAILILLVALPVAASAAHAAAKDCDPGYGSPADRIAACAGGYAEPARIAAAFEAKLGLSADTAGRLAQAMVQVHALEEDDENGQRDPKRDWEPAIRKIESQFIFLLRREPDNEAVAVEAGWFYASVEQELGFVPDQALFDLIRASADPARLAKALIAPVDGSPSDQTAQIVLAALDVRPADSSLWDKAGRAAPAMSWRLAFREEAFRTADAASPDAARLAASWLSDLLEQGLTRQALAAYQGLPPDLRARLDRGEVKDPENLSDLRIGLAVTAFLEGDWETAGRLASLASQAPAQPSDKTTSTEKDASVQLRLLGRMLTPVSDDPFALFVDALDREGPFGGLGTNTGELLLARLAEREGYPALTAYLLEGVAYGLSPNNLEPFEPARGVPPRVRANAAALAAERDALSRGYSQEARAAEYTARTGDGADPAAATIARLLRMPLPAAFEEHPLPADVPLLDLSDEAAEKQLAAAAKGLSLPTGVCLARVEREGSRVAALISSQGYDPTGEVSSGAYWVLLSADGGATWSEPLYTGLRINQPYVVRPVSALPLFAGDHLHVEVEIRELDPAKIYFPPVGLAPKRTARGLYLDIPLEALTRDSDGDGLTDLAEARLLTDPAAPDTDGDGIPDGADPLPTVRESAAEDHSPAALAIAAFVEEIKGAGGRAFIEGVGAPLLCCSAKNKAQGPEKVLFFTGDRALFSALHPSLRIVVLTHDEQKEAERRFGPFYPTDIQLFLLDRTGRHAFLIWSAGWQGGAVRVDEKNGAWKATEVGGWFT